ncbi:MAG: hypothetical protein CM1200mP33_5740 [Chloroflexota bacterium]|nr:MAG: hypothetical protein CM1200mP33_5740 [Chloroflexota bacterium]
MILEGKNSLKKYGERVDEYGDKIYNKCKEWGHPVIGQEKHLP